VHNDSGVVEGGGSAGNPIPIISHAVARAEGSDCHQHVVMPAFVVRWLAIVGEGAIQIWHENDDASFLCIWGRASHDRGMRSKL